MSTQHVAIIGGGITGLAAAHALQTGHPEYGYTLLEAGDRLGGKLVTHHVDGFTIEGGPDSFITQKKEGLDLCRELGLYEELVACNQQHSKVYIVHHDQLHELPAGLRLTVPTRWGPFVRTPLLSPAGKLRMALEPLVPRRTDESDESLGDFVRRRFGREVLETFAGPIMAGIYVSDPEQMSMQSTFPQFAGMEREHGSLVRTMRRARKKASTLHHKPPPLFMAPRDGMQSLADGLAARLTGTLRTGCAAQGLTRRASRWLVQLATGEVLEADRVVLALPAAAAADLIRERAAEPADELDTFRTVSTATISLAYDERGLSGYRGMEGFGFLVPRRENRPILACTCSSVKFPGRAPEASALFRVFVGGPHGEQVARRSEADLLALARDQLEDLLGLYGTPIHHRVFRWLDANPQYDVGHNEKIKRLEERLDRELPGVVLAGGSYHGVGVPNCIGSGRRAVERITA